MARASLLVSILSFFTDAERAPERGLPRRVQGLIAHEEGRSEQLIGWVQLFVVMAFAALYLVAPRPADAPAGMLLDPVPAALIAYGLFTVVRLWLAYRQRLPGVLLLVSILADIGLLVGMIWSFHAQYGQTAPFSLKVPTFVYLFVFIAIRALRFDYRYVLIAGAAAALAWAGLVIAVIRDSGGAAITRSFVTHVNSNSVLIGAEVDKLLALMLVTGVLAFSMYRGRRLFITAIRDEVALADLSRFFGKGVSDTVVDAETQAVAGTAVEREAAIMMLDIRGFTTLTGGLSPRQVVEILTSLHARIIPIVRRHGGVIDKFMGDGIMATFGAVTPSATAAADALRALEQIMAEVRAWQADERTGPADAPSRKVFEVHGAVVAGPVLFAIVGAGDRLEYTVIGSAVNLAAKLEKANKTEGTRALTTIATLETAIGQGYTPKAPARKVIDQDVAGIAQRLDLAVIVS